MAGVMVVDLSVTLDTIDHAISCQLIFYHRSLAVYRTNEAVMPFFSETTPQQ